MSALAVTAGAVLTLLPSAGVADVPVLGSVTIQGKAVVGSTLTAVVVANDPAAVIEYRWQRCTTAKRADCSRIKEATDAPSYTVTAADDGDRLAVRAVAVVGGVQMAAWSQLTSVVTGPTPPVPTPTPTASPTPTPDPGADPAPDPDDSASTFDQSGGASPSPPAAKPAAPSVKAPSYLHPFPVVRVKGTLAPGGARISLLRVKAPNKASVHVQCKGPRCHVRRRSVGGGRVGALERFLRAGTTITIRVSRRGYVGKYVRLVIRDGSAPRRRDACLLPGSTKPASCPPA
jgi:hypothetical protein